MTNTAETIPLQDYDVAIVGAGPAGASCAIRLARRGLRTLLIDRAQFPRTKVCGGCLNARAVAALSELGALPSILQNHPSHIESMQLRGFGRRAAIALSGGIAISRAALDMTLAQLAVDSCATFLDGAQARLGAVDPEFRTVRITRDGASHDIRARAIVWAAGLSGMASEHGQKILGPPHSRIGAGAIATNAPDEFRPGVIYMACARMGYAGLARMEDGSLNIAAAIDPAYIREANGIAHAVAGILKSAGFEWEFVQALPWIGAPALTRRPASIAGERVFQIGDAAGYVEPFTGEGMSWAIEQAALVAPLVARAVNAWTPSLATEWEQCHRRNIRGRQRLCRIVARGLRHPFIAGNAIGLAAKLPRLASPFAQRFGFGDRIGIEP